MLDVLKDKKTYCKMVVSLIPLVAVCSAGFEAVTAAVILVLAQLICCMAVFLLKGLLNEKTSRFAALIIAVGAVGMLSMAASIFALDYIENLGVYVPLISISAVLLLDFDKMTASTFGKAVSDTAVLSVSAAFFLISCGILRELFGLGSLFGFDIYSEYITPISFLAKPAGGFLVAAIFVMVYNLIIKADKKEVAE